MESWRVISRILALIAVCGFFVPMGCELVGTQNAHDKPRTSKATSVQKHPLDEPPLSMLSYYFWIQQCSLGELKMEYERLQSGSADDDEPRNHLRLALLLSLPEKPFGDDSRASTLLENYLSTDRGSSEDEAFALFLLKQLDERRQYKAQVETLVNQIKDYQIVMSELKKERALRSKLEDQVQQLKNIEENLIEREQINMPPATE